MLIFISSNIQEPLERHIKTTDNFGGNKSGDDLRGGRLAGGQLLEDFTVVSDLKREYRVEPTYSNYVQTRPELRGFNDRFANKQLHTGRQAEFINKGAAKNRINYARPFYEEDLEYNDCTEWWNEDRTFDDY
jgi:hypothetical protein